MRRLASIGVGFLVGVAIALSAGAAGDRRPASDLEYVVAEPGDSWWSIRAELGLSCTHTELWGANGGGGLLVGQIVLIPPSCTQPVTPTTTTLVPATTAPPTPGPMMPTADTIGPRCTPTETITNTEALARLRVDKYLSCVTVTGGLSLAGSDGAGWLIEDVRFEGGNYGVRSYASVAAFTGTQAERPVLRYVTIAGRGSAGTGQTCSAALYGRDIIVEHADIYGCQDGIKASDRMEVRYSWVHDLDHPAGAHADGIQIVSGLGIVMHGNRFDAYVGYSSDGTRDVGETASGMLQTGTVTGPLEAAWTNNWFAGGHYTFRGSTDPQVHYVLRNNRWLANGTSVVLGRTDLPPNRHGPVTAMGDEDMDASNVWDDSGLPVGG